MIVLTKLAKRIIGGFVLLNILPVVCLIAELTHRHGDKCGYGIAYGAGWLLDIIVLSIVGFGILIIKSVEWTFDIKIISRND